MNFLLTDGQENMRMLGCWDVGIFECSDVRMFGLVFMFEFVCLSGVKIEQLQDCLSHGVLH